MSPRRYRLGQRQAAIEETRARILSAARELLAAPGGIAGFTIDAVARQAGVARMTIYYQFGSKTGLLEALCDALAARGGLKEKLPGAFGQADPRVALDELIRAFGHFWAADRLVTRRLHALAALDPEIEKVVQARQERRRGGLGALVGRLTAAGHFSGRASAEELTAQLQVLTGFETFDALAGAGRSPEDVVPLVQRLARAALGLGRE